jgi:hypothetical protein
VGKLDQIPQEIRAQIAARLLQSIGAGPIEPPSEESELESEGIEIFTHEFEGALTKVPRRAATADEVAALNRPPEPPFAVGDTVRWRPGLQLGDWPKEGEAAIISQVIDPPIYDSTKTDASAGAHRNDIALAFADDLPEGPARVFEFIFDSRRFERVED